MSATGWLHTILATIALLAGAWNLLRPKGTALHRRAGRLFAFSVVGANLTALTIYRLTGHFELFHILALVSLASLGAGVLPALLHRPRRYWLELHYFGIGWAYAGLCAAFANELLARVPFLRPITVPGAFDAAALARIFRVSGILSGTITLLAIGLLAWRYSSVMASVGRRARVPAPGPRMSTATLIAPAMPSATLTGPAMSAATLAGLGQVLLLSGGITFVRDVTVQFSPGAMRVLALWLGMATLAATLAVAYRRRGEPADLRWVAAYYFLLLFSLVWSGMLGQFSPRDLTAFQPSLVLCGMVMLGVYCTDTLVILGLLATGLIVAGYRFSGPWFPLWAAIVGGGAQAWCGWHLLTLCRRPAPSAAAALPVHANP